jgi:hypothetical protein
MSLRICISFEFQFVAVKTGTPADFVTLPRVFSPPPAMKGKKAPTDTDAYSDTGVRTYALNMRAIRAGANGFPLPLTADDARFGVDRDGVIFTAV